MRTGLRSRPSYRISVFDAHAPRDGRSLETLGTYNPLADKEEEKTVLKRDRVIYWLDHGATPTETVRNILKRNGIHV